MLVVSLNMLAMMWLSVIPTAEEGDPADFLHGKLAVAFFMLDYLICLYLVFLWVYQKALPFRISFCLICIPLIMLLFQFGPRDF